VDRDGRRGLVYRSDGSFPEAAVLTLTGQLGEVMKESAQAARSYLWSHAVEFGIDPEKIKQNGVHLHVPAGAIPKTVRAPA
jgi:ATP-dependent Lon protease